MLFQRKEIKMESTYKVIQLIGSSSESWEKAASNAIEKAAKSLRDLRIAEVVEMDLQIDDGKVVAYRTKLKISFKYED
jgi:flavin-binding protein dodecin